MNNILKLFLITALLTSSNLFAQEWQDTTVSDGLDNVKGLKIISNSGEESLSIFRKNAKYASMGNYPKEMVFLEFKTDSMDQIYSKGPIIYKADKGKAYPLGSLSRLGMFTGSINSMAFHGKSSETCGIIGNMIHSDKLTVRYETTGKQTKDVEFKLPSNSGKLFEFLGLDSSKDCTKIN